jgi:hypothetical protein
MAERGRVGSWNEILLHPNLSRRYRPKRSRSPSNARAGLSWRSANEYCPQTPIARTISFSILKGLFCVEGIRLLSQWAPIDVRELRTSWGVAPNTTTKYMEIAKSFFNYAVANKWIVKSSATLIKGLEEKRPNNQRERIPFSDEDLQRMYDAREHQYGKTP